MSKHGRHRSTARRDQDDARITPHFRGVEKGVSICIATTSKDAMSYNYEYECP
jgi:hypothetical protein